MWSSRPETTWSMHSTVSTAAGSTDVRSISRRIETVLAPVLARDPARDPAPQFPEESVVVALLQDLEGIANDEAPHPPAVTRVPSVLEAVTEVDPLLPERMVMLSVEALAVVALVVGAAAAVAVPMQREKNGISPKPLFFISLINVLISINSFSP